MKVAMAETTRRRVRQEEYNRENGINPESIKKSIGSAFPGAEVREMEVSGINLAEGIPRKFTISSNEVLEALSEPLNQVVKAVKEADSSFHVSV